MDLPQNSVILVLISIIFCACVAALPAVEPNQEGDIAHLVSLIGKLRDIESQQKDTADRSWSSLNDDRDSQKVKSPSSAALKQGFLGFDKRQGAWSYDYGLGGGRFGKRYYGDYGIGGGRFGRDVDHVDLMDTNDNL